MSSPVAWSGRGDMRARAALAVHCWFWSLPYMHSATTKSCVHSMHGTSALVMREHDLIMFASTEMAIHHCICDMGRRLTERVSLQLVTITVCLRLVHDVPVRMHLTHHAWFLAGRTCSHTIVSLSAFMRL